MAPFIWLGSKRAKKNGVDHPAALLDYAAKMGLPVPNGGILLHEFYLYALQEGLLHHAEGQLTVPDPHALITTLLHQFHFPQLAVPVVVQAAFSPAAATPPPPYLQYQPVPQADSHAFGQALCQAWQEAEEAPTRRDLLLLERVAAQQHGIALTPASGNTDTVHGEQTFTMPKLSLWRWPTANEPFARRLQMLLRGIRRTFGPRNGATDWRGGWRVEWVDDGRVCWLVSLTPMAESQ